MNLRAAVWLTCTLAACAEPGPARIDVKPNIVGLRAGTTYAYVVRAGEDVVLVGSGSDKSGRELLAGLGELGLTPEAIDLVLLPTTHAAHAGAAHLIPHARVVVGDGDDALLSRDRMPRAYEAWIAARTGKSPPVPATLVRALAGERFVVGTLTVDVVSTPGVSPGSLCFVVDRVAFVGDALAVRGNTVELPSRWRAESPTTLGKVIARLGQAPFDTLVDARGGMLAEAWQAVASVASRARGERR